MLEAKLAQSAILRKIFETIKEMISDVNLDCTEQGLLLQAMDNSHVSLVSVALTPEGFINYRCDRPRMLGLNMNAVVKVFKLSGLNDSVTLQAEDNTDSVTFTFESPGVERMSSFSLKLMSIDTDKLQIPGPNHVGDATIVMPSKEYAACCKNISEFSDVVSIEVDKTQVKFRMIGDAGNGQIVFKSKDLHDSELGVDLEVNEAVSQQFAVKYLNLFAKASQLSEVCQLVLSKDSPIEIRFEIKNKNEFSEMKKVGEVKFFLAPKMDDSTYDAPMEQ